MKLARFVSLAFVVCGLSFRANLQAQSFDLQFVEVTNNGTNLDAKVQIKSSGTNFNLYNGNLVFNYSGNIASPTLQTVYNFSGAPSYGTMNLTQAGSSGSSINIYQNSGPYTSVSSTWMDVATIRWTVTNGSGTYTLSWNGSLTEVYKAPGGASNMLTNGTFNGLTNSLLPVQLVLFQARLSGKEVALSWTTATEMNLNGFEVERSNDNVAWQKIGFVLGHGASNAPNIYDYSDKNIEYATVLYYRLKIVDRDGEYKYSASAKVAVNSLASVPELLKSFPNPFNPNVTVHFTLPDTRRVTVTIFDEAGNLVARIYDNELLRAGYYSNLFAAPALASGKYLLRMQAGDYTATESLLLTK